MSPTSNEIEDAIMDQGWDWRKIVMRSILALLLAASVFGACSLVNSKLGFKDDHFAEEAAENLIKDQVGLDIDLTPGSPE